MKTGTQPAGNKSLGIQGAKKAPKIGKPSSAPPTAILATGRGGKSSARSKTGGGMGIGTLGGGKMGKKRGR